jgi:hypothetical protein
VLDTPHTISRIDIKRRKYLILESKRKDRKKAEFLERPFVTAGWTVVQVTVAVAIVDLGLLGLIIRQVCVFFFIHASWIVLIILS